MGYWCDMSDAYRTMDASYVESVWWSLKQIADKGLLVEDHRVAPYCPRCGTALSDHEVAQGYQTVTDPSVYVRFPVTSGPLRRSALRCWSGRRRRGRWSPTPPSRCNPGVTYVAARAGDEVLVVAEPLLGVLGDDVRRRWRCSSASPARRWSTRRTRGRSTWSRSSGAHFVGVADYVTTDSGTGLVHQSPAFGADDMLVAKRYGLPVVNPVRPDGTFEEHLPLVGGQFFKAADAALVADLRERGLLFREQPYEHSYPHCWRCDTALLYYALPSWYIRTTAIKDRLLEENERTDLVPLDDQARPLRRLAREQHRLGAVAQPLLGHAAADLALHRRRARTGRRTARSPSSARTPAQELSALDPHRPYVDDVVVPCRACGGRGPARAGGHRRLVRLGLDAVRAGRLPAGRASSRPTRRSSSARRSTRPAAGSTRS